MADYTAWYRVGTVALTTGSKIVTGTNTYWLSADLHTGDIFSIDNITDYEIQSVNSNTQLTLKTAYAGAATTEAAYSIVRNFTATMAAQVAAHTANLLNDMRRYIDADMQSIHGKSAYQIACEKGFAGTESEWVASLNAYGVAKSEGYTGSLSEWLASLKGDSAYAVAVQNGFNGSEEAWLESLKADNEWATLDARTSALIESTGWSRPGQHNCLYRGKNLGPFTAEHSQAIRNGSYKDMYIGDFFQHTITENGADKVVEDVIAQFYFSLQNDHLSQNIVLFRRQHLVDTEDYQATFNRRPSGTEGEDDYDPGTIGNLYPTSNWYTVVRPKFIEQIEGIYGADHVLAFNLAVPSGMNLTTPTAWVNLSSKAHLPSASMLGLPYFSLDDGAFPVNYGGHGYAYKTLPLVSHWQHITAASNLYGYNWTGQVACAEGVKLTNGTLWVACLCMGGLKLSAEYKRGYGSDGIFGAALNPIFCVK